MRWNLSFCIVKQKLRPTSECQHIYSMQHITYFITHTLFCFNNYFFSESIRDMVVCISSIPSTSIWSCVKKFLFSKVLLSVDGSRKMLNGWNQRSDHKMCLCLECLFEWRFLYQGMFLKSCPGICAVMSNFFDKYLSTYMLFALHLQNHFFSLREMKT